MFDGPPFGTAGLIAFGLVAGVALILSGVGFALDTYASNGKWIELGNEEPAFLLIGVG